MNVIDCFDTQKEMADIFGVTQGAVSHWRKEGAPRAVTLMMQIAAPQLFGNDAEQIIARIRASLSRKGFIE